MQSIAVASLVTERTGKASWAALAAAATFLPMGLLAPVGGALADRIDRRRFMIVANLVDAMLACVLVWLAASGRASPALITGVVFVEGCVSALRIPFYQSMMPDLVPPEDLLGAVSLGSANYNLGRVIGPTLAALVIQRFSFTAAFAANAISFLPVIGALFFIKLKPPPHRRTSGLWQDIRAGARAAWETPACRSAIGLVSAAALLAAPFIALIPAVALRLTDGGTDKEVAALTGVLTTAQGVGAVIGALAVAPLAERFGRRRMLLVNLSLLPFGLVAYGFAEITPVAVAALAVVGWLYVGVLSGLSAVVQLRAPTEFRGRILSLYMLALGGLYPLGALLQGVIADRSSLGLATTVGAVGLAALLVFLRLAKPHLLRALEPAPVADDDDALADAAASPGPAGATQMEPSVPAERLTR